MKYKQVIVIRKDLKMGPGKMVSQGSHASLCAFLNSDNKIRDLWLKDGAKKVVVKVKNLKELMSVYEKAKKAKLPTAMIKDAGRTQVKPNTITCIGIGPAKEEDVDKITKDLKLL